MFSPFARISFMTMANVTPRPGSSPALGPGTYSGTREDVIGETTVRVSGNVARFTYRVDLNPGGKPNIVRFYDKLTLKNDGAPCATQRWSRSSCSRWPG
jgi:hypothetical protein